MESIVNKLAVIGGSGFDQISELEIIDSQEVVTPYGKPSSVITKGRLFNQEITFLPRHGSGHSIPPHEINYRANIWALHLLEINHIISFAAVGGISDKCSSGKLVIPDQLIDYTWGRDQTFHGSDASGFHHIDFTHPYSLLLREKLIKAADSLKIEIIPTGTYAVTQGPRLETPAEIRRMEKDGADIVGMTGMPESVLARELNIEYACVAMVVNLAAGKGEGEISIEMIMRNLELASQNALKLFHNLVLEQL